MVLINSNDEINKVLYLNDKEDTYLNINKISNDLIKYGNDNFNELFDLHPNDLGIITKDSKDIISNRYHKSYLFTPKYDNNIFKSYNYMYGGINDNVNEPLPKLFQPYLDYINKIEPNYYNQVIINWFNDGTHHIPYHSDCIKFMDKDKKISIITIGESNRIFSIKSKNIDSLKLKKIKLDIICNNGCLLTMNENFQNEYWHSIPKMKNCKKPRISISFRRIIL